MLGTNLNAMPPLKASVVLAMNEKMHTHSGIGRAWLCRWDIQGNGGDTWLAAAGDLTGRGGARSSDATKQRASGKVVQSGSVSPGEGK